jgi:YegS/Rv2252/BmrU family lipid kinase
MSISLKDIIFVINPRSGTSNYNLLDELNKLNVDIDYFISESLEAFDQFFKTKALNYKVIVICGGDGTINSSLKYFVANPQLTLAVLPGGSGNGFARELGFKKNIKSLIEQIRRGNVEMVDVMNVNQEYSCNAMGVGLDSYVATEFEKKPGRGLKTYIHCTIEALFTYKPIRAKITTQAEVIEGEYMSVCVANIRQFGNNAIIAPMADRADGVLDLVLIKESPFYAIPELVYRLFKGTLKNSKYIKFVRAEKLTIESNSPSYHIDGEVRQMTAPLNIEIETQIKVINPTKNNRHA